MQDLRVRTSKIIRRTETKNKKSRGNLVINMQENRILTFDTMNQIQGHQKLTLQGTMFVCKDTKSLACKDIESVRMAGIRRQGAKDTKYNTQDVPYIGMDPKLKDIERRNARTPTAS
jgi:hypothetical protein